MSLDDLDFPQKKNNSSVQKRFSQAGIILLSFGILISGILLFIFSKERADIYLEPIIYFPILIGIIPFFFSFCYDYFEHHVNEPLKDNWKRIHFYLTIVPLYLIQLFGIANFYLLLSGVNPLLAAGTPIIIPWLIILIGQIFFMANLFRSLKISNYKNANFHPTHYLFFFMVFFFLVKSGFIYFSNTAHRGVDIPYHNSYFVTSIFQLNIYVVILFSTFSILYYFINKKFRYPLNSLLSKGHFFIMTFIIFYFFLFLNAYEKPTHRFYISPESLESMRAFILNQWTLIFIGFLFAQTLFGINFLRSVVLSTFYKK